TDIRAIAALQDAGKYFVVGAGDIAIWLAFALAFRIDPFAIWLGDRIIADLESKRGKYDFSPESPFYVAFIQFYAGWRKKKFAVKDHCDKPMGPYQEILDAWNNETRYAKVCIRACDYHLDQMHEVDGYSEFEWAPQDLLPVEILMIRRIRED